MRFKRSGKGFDFPFYCPLAKACESQAWHFLAKQCPLVVACCCSRSGLEGKAGYASQVTALYSAASELMNKWDLWNFGFSSIRVVQLIIGFSTLNSMCSKRKSGFDCIGTCKRLWTVRIEEKSFRIAEVEAYVHSPHHADPYAHGDEGCLGMSWLFGFASLSPKASKLRCMVLPPEGWDLQKRQLQRNGLGMW